MSVITLMARSWVTRPTRQDRLPLCDAAAYRSRCSRGVSCSFSEFGANNHKYTPPQLVEVDYDSERGTYGGENFPEAQAILTSLAPDIACRLPTDRVPMIERARRYLAATPAAIQGQRGDIKTFRVCCKLIFGFGLSDNDALSLLASWNERCYPPWSDSALRAKLVHAHRYGGGQCHL